MEASKELLEVLEKVRKIKSARSTLTEEEKVILGKEAAQYMNEVQSDAVDEFFAHIFENDIDDKEYETTLVMLADFVSPADWLFDQTQALDRSIKNFIGICLREGWLRVP